MPLERFPDSSIRHPQPGATYSIPNPSLLGHFIPDFPTGYSPTQREVTPPQEIAAAKPATTVFDSEQVPTKPDTTSFDPHPAEDRNLPLDKKVKAVIAQIETTRPFSLPPKRNRSYKSFPTA